MDKLFIVTVKPKKAYLDVFKTYFFHVNAKTKADALRKAAEHSEVFADTDPKYTNPAARQVQPGQSFSA